MSSVMLCVCTLSAGFIKYLCTVHDKSVMVSLKIECKNLCVGFVLGSFMVFMFPVLINLAKGAGVFRSGS